MSYKRRQFLKSTALLSSAILLKNIPSLGQGQNSKGLQVSCQHYTWLTYFRREGREWEKNMDDVVKALKEVGLTGYEPSFTNPEHVDKLKTPLTKSGIQAKSMYVNSWLHEEGKTKESIDQVLAIARQAKDLGVEIIVTNPSPIQWGKPIDKTDKQIQTQAVALDRLGAELRDLGIKLAYHNHDMEMRQSAREFHHMLMNTNPENVSLCLDAQWIHRGSGNSQVALFDIVEMYADRIVELHIRQTQDGVWSEVFGEGDIDYGRLVEKLLEKDLRPHLVLEQAVEEGTPNTMSAEEAISESLRNLMAIFESFGE